MEGRLKLVYLTWNIVIYQDYTLPKKWSFPWSIFSENVTNSAGNCGFGHI